MAKPAPELQPATVVGTMAIDAEACAATAVRQHEQAMHQAPVTAGAVVADDRAHHHHHHAGTEGQGSVAQGVRGQRFTGPGVVEQEARSILPSVGTIVQAGAFGAALGGMTTGVMEMARVKQGEITSDEAIRNVVKSSAQGAATMAVASVASQVVRSHPVFGIIALAAAGIGAFVILSGANANASQAPASAAQPAKPSRPPVAAKKSS